MNKTKFILLFRNNLLSIVNVLSGLSCLKKPLGAQCPYTSAHYLYADIIKAGKILGQAYTMLGPNYILQYWITILQDFKIGNAHGCPALYQLLLLPSVAPSPQ